MFETKSPAPPIAGSKPGGGASAEVGTRS